MSYYTSNIDITLTKGDFEKLNGVMSNSNYVMIKNAYDAISQVEGWNFLKDFDEESFSMCTDPMMTTIYRKMEELGYVYHSASSFYCVLRNMESLAKYGNKYYMENI